MLVETRLLDTVKGLKKCPCAVDALLIANSAKSAAAILERTRATMAELVAMEEELFAAEKARRWRRARAGIRHGT